MGGSKSSSSSKPVDMTPDAFKALQGPFGEVLGKMIGQYTPGGVEAIMGGYKGPTTSPITANEQNALNAINTTATNNTGQNRPVTNTLANPTQVVGMGGTPTTGMPQSGMGPRQTGGSASTAPGFQPRTGAMPQSPANGVSGYQPGAFQPAPGETDFFTQRAMQDPATAKGPSQQSKDLMAATGATGSAQGAANFVNATGTGNANKGTMADFTAENAAASQTGAFGGPNPFSDAYINQAQRRTMENLEETLGRTLPGRFTQAGHIVQPQGSSAFDRAAAIASRGATQEMGDIATRINYQSLADAQNREATAMGQERGLRGEADARTDLAIQNQLDRAMQIPGMEAQIENLGANTSQILGSLPGQFADTALRLAQTRGQEATTGLTQAQTGTQNQQTGKIAAETDLTKAQTSGQDANTDLTRSQIGTQEMDTMIKNLQAQALPRLIQDMGVERGMEAFNNQVNSLLSGLGIAAGVTRPVIGNESKSSSGSVQLK